ncbi:phage portal protein, HK97 family [Enterococcus faecalis]|uniref:phage portal protein n=1 Tax=Enterococcus faecalis TaxID=1351 RepID=UPI00088A76BC|nr:phage portal protein [Enterococcus faecalis]SDN92673.1 phage portal protein, HK97 family [Enterococcus faecalis]
MWPFKQRNKLEEVTTYKMVIDKGNGFFAWDGNVYQSDIVRSAIRPKARAIGKAVGKHIRRSLDKAGKQTTQINPEVYMKFLLQEPNPLMTGQLLQEKLATQLELNGNAFAYIQRYENGLPKAIYPIDTTQVSLLSDSQGNLYAKFQVANGRQYTFLYADVLHLRKDFYKDPYFGQSIFPVLEPLMEIVNTTDQGLIKAVQNSNVIRWLLKFNQTLRPEDLEKQAKSFRDSYLSSESESIGVAASDSKFDPVQVEPKDYVPNEKQNEATRQRILSLFNTNDKIVQSKYNENEWISYYESQIEPDLKQMSEQWTIKLFSRRERGFGNEILFESSSLTFASMQTKLNLMGAVDRGAMTINEWRGYMALPPVEGGDILIRRKDTGKIDEFGNETADNLLKGGEKTNEDDSN